MSLRFGTDGVRAEAFTVLSEDYVRALGSAAARTLLGDTILVGRDTRESGAVLQHAFSEGCAAEGVRVRDLGVVPTPAVAWTSRAEQLGAAVLSASHNRWQDNGVKLFDAGGKKLADKDQEAIEAMLDSRRTPPRLEPTVEAGSIEPYVESLVDSVEGRSFAGVKVVLDCANGAASTTARRVFERLGADVVSVADLPDGRNINAGVGSTHPEFVATAVVEHGAAVGFAFDGDADRVIGCGRDGTIIDGDRILAMNAVDRMNRNLLTDQTVVITVMANLGFRKAMREQNISMVETPVGDRHVLAALDRGNFSLGGEQSGHIIHRDMATTGDGVLTAIQLVDAGIRRGVDVGAWANEVMTSYPQVLKNVVVEGPIDDLDGRLAPAIAAEEELLGDSGRVLIRASGTEPLIRVMVEAATVEAAQRSASRLVAEVETL